MSSNGNHNSKKQKTAAAAPPPRPFVPDRSLTVDFDPTALGLPAGWRLTDHSELKG